MKSTRYRVRGKSAETNDRELEMRRAVRDRIREIHGPSAKPPGEGWWWGLTEYHCTFCGDSMVEIVVPRYEAVALLYCAHCGFLLGSERNSEQHHALREQLRDTWAAWQGQT